MKESKPVAIVPSKLNAIGFVVFGIVPIKQQSIFYLPFAFSVDPLLGVGVRLTEVLLLFLTGHTQKRVVGGVCASVPLSGYFVVFEIALRLDFSVLGGGCLFFPFALYLYYCKSSLKSQVFELE